MNICIFGASSEAIDDNYKTAVEDLAFRLGSAGHGMVFGGGKYGLMGAAARGMKHAGAEIIGVVPTFFREETPQVLYHGCTEQIWTDTMSERKLIMERRADAFIITPGGVGTFDEIFEVLTLVYIGRMNKPVVFYDLNGYYEPVRQMIEKAIGEQFTKERIHEQYIFTDSADEIIRYLNTARQAVHGH